MDSTTGPVRVLVADDQRLVREGIIMLLNSAANVEVVAEARNGYEAIRLTEQARPDVVVMDLRMPEKDGVLATQELLAEPSNCLTRVLILSMFNDDDWVLRALRAGASGYLLKDAAPDQLIDAVRTVAAGDSWLDPAVAGQVIVALRASVEKDLHVPELDKVLTRREREVLALVAEGMSNTEISGRLTVSLATVRTHVCRILLKTGSRDRAQAVALAYRTGLVRPPTLPR
ncbi:MAG TPA: response regulator transcription factor [Microlunatus sp.]